MANLSLTNGAGGSEERKNQAEECATQETEDVVKYRFSQLTCKGVIIAEEGKRVSHDEVEGAMLRHVATMCIVVMESIDLWEERLISRNEDEALELRLGEEDYSFFVEDIKVEFTEHVKVEKEKQQLPDLLASINTRVRITDRHRPVMAVYRYAYQSVKLFDIFPGQNGVLGLAVLLISLIETLGLPCFFLFGVLATKYGYSWHDDTESVDCKFGSCYHSNYTCQRNFAGRSSACQVVRFQFLRVQSCLGCEVGGRS